MVFFLQKIESRYCDIVSLFFDAYLIDRQMTSIKLYLKVAILALFISDALSLPQEVHFGGATNTDQSEKDPAGVNPRLGLVASVLGKY